mmetsp:Transcript_17369/g.48975  ORF Transcript_17369/g.48975 Transcript_17369/m.48975 type:complete len:206 (+) Transcript_17369:301-918(+)
MQKSAPRGSCNSSSLVHPGIVSPRRLRKHTRPSAQSLSRLQSPWQCPKFCGWNHPTNTVSPIGNDGDDDGRIVGDGVGMDVGFLDTDGCCDSDGDSEGDCDVVGLLDALGCIDNDGLWLGLADAVGWSVGATDGDADGDRLGRKDGDDDTLGRNDGDPVATIVGVLVGMLVGASVASSLAGPRSGQSMYDGMSFEFKQTSSTIQS